MSLASIAPHPRRGRPTRGGRTFRPLRVVLPLLLVLLLQPVAQPQVAEAAGKTSITDVRVVAVSTKAFRVRLASLGKGWKYTLYASTDKSAVTYASLKEAPYRVSSKRPDLTLRTLPSTTKVYWFRVQATRKTSHHTSDFFSVGLRPAAPNALEAVSVERGAVQLRWSGAAERFEVQRASTSAFASGTATSTTAKGSRVFTPYGVAPGTRTWFRVRGVNATSAGAWSTAVPVSVSAGGQAVRAMTYNLLSLTADGTSIGGSEPVAAWGRRRTAAADAILEAAPDVVGVQEGGAYTGVDRGPRQVDSLVDALSGYRLARTEAPPGEKGYYRIGSYVLYRSDVLVPVGAGGSWDLGEVEGGFHKWAAYQVFRHRGSGTTFLFVSVHLLSGGKNGDAVRRDETTTLLQRATSYAASNGGLPVVWAGDFNSHEAHSLDGPAVAMRGVWAADARDAAQSLTNAEYNSSNVYRRTPPKHGLSIDHLYVSPGVGVSTWGQVLDLDEGKFRGTIPSDHNPVYADLVLPR